MGENPNYTEKQQKPPKQKQKRRKRKETFERRKRKKHLLNAHGNFVTPPLRKNFPVTTALHSPEIFTAKLRILTQPTKDPSDHYCDYREGACPKRE